MQVDQAQAQDQGQDQGQDQDQEVQHQVHLEEKLMKMMYQVILLILIMEEDLPKQKNPRLLKPLAVMLSKITKNSVHLIEEQLQISNLSWLNAQQDAVLRNNIKLWVWVSIQKNL